MLEQICIPVQEELRSVDDVIMREVRTGMDTMGPVVKYMIGNGGKRIRPAIFLLTARMIGVRESFLPKIAAAIEMLHTASLIHDDVVDDAAIRRGKPSAKAKWGNQVSVLVGDLLFCHASKLMVEQGNKHLMNAMIKTVCSTTEGELLEIAHQNDVSVDADTYMKIIRGKTAELFAMAAKAAAVIAGLEPSFEDALWRYGNAVGVAFQLADDALDYVADENLFGKRAGTDLGEGKLTYPLIVALQSASEKERRVIQGALIAGKPTAQRFGEVAGIISRYGGIEATCQIARKFSSDAKVCLREFKSSIERDSLMMLADYAVERRE